MLGNFRYLVIEIYDPPSVESYVLFEPVSREKLVLFKFPAWLVDLLLNRRGGTKTLGKKKIKWYRLP